MRIRDFPKNLIDWWKAPVIGLALVGLAACSTLRDVEDTARDVIASITKTYCAEADPVARQVILDNFNAGQRERGAPELEGFKCKVDGAEADAAVMSVPVE